jgi:PAS domain-containing protein
MSKQNSFKLPIFFLLTLASAIPAVIVVGIDQLNNQHDLALLKSAAALLLPFFIASIISSYLNHDITNELKVITKIFSHPSEKNDKPLLHAKYSETNEILMQANAWLTRKGRSEAALKASEERLNLALSTGGFGTWDWDLINDELNWDTRNHRLYGIKPGSFSGKYRDFLSFLHPDDKNLLTQQISTITENRDTSIHEVEYRIVLPDGSIRHLADRCEVFRSSANQIERMIGITWERSTKKQTEEPS